MKKRKPLKLILIVVLASLTALGIYVKYKEVQLSYCIDKSRAQFPKTLGRATQEQIRYATQCENDLSLTDTIQLLLH